MGFKGADVFIAKLRRYLNGVALKRAKEFPVEWF
jgi:hypothetical protein